MKVFKLGVFLLPMLASRYPSFALARQYISLCAEKGEFKLYKLLSTVLEVCAS